MILAIDLGSTNFKAGVLTRSLPYAAHPAMRETFFAKHALNLTRLALLERPEDAI